MADETRTVVLGDGAESLHLHEFVLEARGDADETTRRSFSQRRVTIGSAPDNDFVVDDPSVSRRHCAIEVDAYGYRLTDMGSKNGVWIQDLRVRDVYLRPGGTFRVGSTAIRFETTEEEVEIHLSGRSRFGRLLGVSTPMREIFGMLERVAPTDATVLIQGESGTGKELVAEAIHAESERRDGPFIVFDCSAVPSELIESELFGHVKGAFTGAVAARRGAFELADGGTLFIDELGELDLELQPKLLRALERKQIRQVGGDRTVDTNVRIVAATNRNLREAVERGEFREDLYYRFAVIQLRLPPLRERPEDIVPLVEHFLTEQSRQMGRDELDISFQTMEKLKRYDWPGNVRELRNFIERAAVLSSGNAVETKFLRPPEPSRGNRDPSQKAIDGLLEELGVDASAPFKEAKNRLVEAFERGYWEDLLERTDGNVSKAARIAGVHRKSVEYILKKHDIRRSDVATPE